MTLKVAPWILSFMLLSIWLYNIDAQPKDCAPCFGVKVEPVCTASGISLPSPCLAACHGLEVIHNGTCHESDSLLSGLFLPRNLGPAPMAAARSIAFGRAASDSRGDNGSGSSGNSGRSSVGAPDRSAEAIVKRFMSEGFLYVGHVPVTSEAPVADSAKAFVSRLMAPAGDTNGLSQRDFGDTVAKGSSGTSVSRSSGGGRSVGSSATEPASGTATEVAIRGVRVAADGAVYLEAEPQVLDLAQVPASGQTEAVVEDGDSLGMAGSSSGMTGSASQRHLHGLAQTSRTIAGANMDAGLLEERVNLRFRRSGSVGRRRLLADDTFRPDVSSWPHTIIGQLYYRVNSVGYLCSGTWVSPYDVLTAAHCVFDLSRRVESRGFTFETGKMGWYSPDGRVTHSFVTFYRVEYPRSESAGVNYYDIALIRMTGPTLSYMGIKYSCDKIDYPKAETCGYMQDPSGMSYQQCDDCYYTSNACNPMIQPINWCYTVAGQSGSPIYDLSDFHILGVLSGGLAGPEYEDYSIWTPIDAIHFASLRRWMWKPGQEVPLPAPNDTFPLPPPPQPMLPTTCLAIEAGQVRLTEASNGVVWGRAEICYKGVWGMLCSQPDYDEFNANVICRQLGYPEGIVVTQDALPATNLSQPTWLEPTCIGTERRLSECQPLNNGTWKVGVTCPRPLAALCRNTTYQGGTPNVNRIVNLYHCKSEGAVRLQDPGEDNWGRVEFCNSGQWGSICHDGWDDADATVVCRELGYPYGIALKGAVAGGSSPPGPTSMRIWLQQVNCSGSEQRLASCPVLKPLGLTDCGHRWDAGVVCSSTRPERPGVPRPVGSACDEPGAIRLVPDTAYRLNGSSVSGRLEVCYARQWGAVCSAGFDAYDAEVACRQLRYSFGRAVPTNPLKGQPVWMSDVRCDIAKSSYDNWPGRLTTCAFTGMEVAYCPYGIVTGVECTHNAFSVQKFSCSAENSVRVVGGMTNNTGRLEVCRGGQWGTLCRATVSEYTASVTCRQLGYTAGYSLLADAVPAGHPDSPIWQLTYKCRGNETRISDCPLDNAYPSECLGHDLDTGLLCLRAPEPPSLPPPSPSKGSNSCLTPGQVRLVDEAGRLMYDAGRLEICINGRWGTVCGLGFGVEEANVACRHYGFTSGIVALPSTLYGPGQATSPIHMRDVVCRGNEARLTQCSYFSGASGSSCAHSNDVSVVCSWNEQPPPRPGRPSAPGPPAPRQPPPRQPPPRQPPPRQPPPRQPPPRQPPLRQPPPKPNSPPRILPPSPPNGRPLPASSPPTSPSTCVTPGALRLVGGQISGSGMLQYCSRAPGGVLQWGSVCGTSFKPAYASMACRQMNYTDGFALAKPYPGGYGMTGLYYVAQLNQKDLPIWLGDASCPTSATQLSECTSTNSKCIRSADVALACLDTPNPPKRYSCINSTSQLRLVGSSEPGRGIVQVCRNSYWGAICDEGWNDKDATVVCRELGYSAGLAVNGQGKAANGTSIGPFPPIPYDMRVWFTKVACNASEARLADCAKGVDVSDSCIKNSQDAGVICWNGARMD